MHFSYFCAEHAHSMGLRKNCHLLFWYYLAKACTYFKTDGVFSRILIEQCMYDVCTYVCVHVYFIISRGEQSHQ